MPFSLSRHSRLKIIVCLLGVAQLFGCATTEQTTAPVLSDDKAAAELADLFEDFGAEEGSITFDAEDEAEAAVVGPLILDDDGSIDPLDQIAETQPAPDLRIPQSADVQVFDWRVINGATLGNFFTGEMEHRFQRPTAIAVSSEYLYVVDQGADTLFRFDLVSERLEVVLDLKTEVKGEVADIYVNKDFSFYLTDTEAGRVLHFDRHGSLLQVFRNHFNMVRPVAVTVLDDGSVVVADGHYDHLLHFNAMGKLIATYGGRGEEVGEFLNIMTMIKGPDGFYVGARIGRRLQVIGNDGGYLYAFEEGAAIFPAAIAVDRDNRTYVADYMDNTIKVFDRGVLIGTMGSFGSGAGQFKRITDLWLEAGVLYIVDSLNGRIQAARVSPEIVALPPSVPDSDDDLIQDFIEEPLDEAAEETISAPLTDSDGLVDTGEDKEAPLEEIVEESLSVPVTESQKLIETDEPEIAVP